jgi:hypothetical protein
MVSIRSSIVALSSEGTQSTVERETKAKIIRKNAPVIPVFFMKAPLEKILLPTVI